MTDKSGPKQKGGPFKPGQSGNPAGKPKGTRHRATALLEKIMLDDAEEVVKSVIAAAKGGDMVAARVIVDRLVPVRKGRPVTFDLPSIETPVGCGEALNALIRAVANGEITPDEAGPIAGMIETRRKVFEVEEIERRLAALEERRA